MWLLGAALVAAGCTHRLAASAAEPRELTTETPGASPGIPSLAVEVRPGGVVAQLGFTDDDGRRRVRVHDAGDGRIEIRMIGRRKYIAPWSKCARVFAQRTIDLDIRGLEPGHYRVEFTHDGVAAEPRDVSVARADDASAISAAGLRSGSRGC